MTESRPYHCSPAPIGHDRSTKHGIHALLNGKVKRCKPGLCESCDEHPEHTRCETLVEYRDTLSREVEKLPWIDPLMLPMVGDFVTVSLCMFQADRFLNARGLWHEKDGEVQVNAVAQFRNQLSNRLEKLSAALGISPKDRLTLLDAVAKAGERSLEEEYRVTCEDGDSTPIEEAGTQPGEGADHEAS